MSFCIAIGKNAKVYGLYCVVIGDDLEVYGQYQIKVGDNLSIPTYQKKEEKDKLLSEFKELIKLYNALSEQGHAPKDFGSNAEKVITQFIELWQKNSEEADKKSSITEIVEESAVEKMNKLIVKRKN